MGRAGPRHQLAEDAHHRARVDLGMECVSFNLFSHCLSFRYARSAHRPSWVTHTALSPPTRAALTRLNPLYDVSTLNHVMHRALLRSRST